MMHKYDPFALFSYLGRTTIHNDRRLLQIVQAYLRDNHAPPGVVSNVTSHRHVTEHVTLVFTTGEQIPINKAALLAYVQNNKDKPEFAAPKVVKTYPSEPFPPTEHWIMWYGGTFPYPTDTIVRVLFRDKAPKIAPAHSFDFDWYVGEERPEDIMSFHVEDKEPNQ